MIIHIRLYNSFHPHFRLLVSLGYLLDEIISSRNDKTVDRFVFSSIFNLLGLLSLLLGAIVLIGMKYEL